MNQYEFHIPKAENNEFFSKTVPVTAKVPFAKYSANVADMLPFYPIHWHEEMEIIRVTEGTGNFCVDGKWYRGEKGDILLLCPFVMHSICQWENCPLEFDAIVFNLRLLNTTENGALQYFAPMLNEKHSIPCIVRPTDSWHNQLYQSMCALLNQKTDTQSAASELHTMFQLIGNNRLQNVAPNMAEDKRCYTVRSTLEYIRTTFTNNITIQQIAQHCGYSEFYTMKFFKKFTGFSCVDYINNFRLTVAGRQLRDTSEEIFHIARQVGFGNISYFNRQFKKLYGTTPKEFRKHTKQ